MSAMDVHFSSKSNEWATPQDFFNRLNEEFSFDLDPCSDGTNAKCERYFTEKDDGLVQSWAGSTVFMNPPYGRSIKDWIRKAYEETNTGAKVVVALIPARTDTSYWHDYVMKAEEIRLVRGRLKFGDGRNSAPFPSAVVIFRKHSGKLPVLNVMRAQGTS